MNAFAAAFVAVVTAHDSRRRPAALTPCGRSLPLRRADAYPWAPVTGANRPVRGCTCREGQGQECFRD